MALADTFLAEHHRLRRAAAEVAGTDDALERRLRHRAFAWRTTAGRLRSVGDARWPAWILAHLRRCEAVPELGSEYLRQRRLVERFADWTAVRVLGE